MCLNTLHCMYVNDPTVSLDWVCYNLALHLMPVLNSLGGGLQIISIWWALNCPGTYEHGSSEVKNRLGHTVKSNVFRLVFGFFPGLFGRFFCCGFWWWWWLVVIFLALFGFGFGVGFFWLLGGCVFVFVCGCWVFLNIPTWEFSVILITL